MIDSMTSSHSIQIKDSQKGWTMFKPIYTETVRIFPYQLDHNLTKQEVNAVQVVGRKPVTVSDKLAHGAVKLFR
jgi:hypothetical protein